jgi:hypothetical protein
MVMEPQRLLPADPRGAALQLYAAASQLAQQNRAVAPWANFLQFGIPGVFGNSLLPHHGFGTSLGNPQNLGSFNGSTCSTNSSTSSQQNRGPMSEDSNDDRGELPV